MVLGVFLVLGVAGRAAVVGCWSTPAEFTKLASGGAMGENELGKQFGADGWFVVIGFARRRWSAGLVLTGLAAAGTRC